MKRSSTTLLCVLDGIGLNPNPEGNAVHLAETPNLDRLMETYPNSTLVSHGERVGLPAGQMGNSEVGHLNIGAGRVVEQWLLRISNALERGELAQIEAYQRFCKNVENASTVHLIGLFSDGGVHSHSDHLRSLIEQLTGAYSGKVALHLLTDGRDTPPEVAEKQLEQLMEYLSSYPTCQIASIGGRFYGMDRDKRWERVEQAYNAIALGEAPEVGCPASYLRASYEEGITDEFIVPACVQPTPIRDTDGVIFWNFREDRMRQIVRVLCSHEFSEFERRAPVFPPERVLTFTEYDAKLPFPYLFAPMEIKRHLGAYLSELGLSQFRVAETEKYPHVTYFLNGGEEAPFEGEDRQMVPSPREVRTYDQKPEMSAHAVTELVVEGVHSGDYDLVVVNLANGDMVGHTGDLSAAVQAVETVDECLGKMLAAVEQVGGQAVIIADHGNADQMIHYGDGSPHTAHTTHPVPIILFNPGQADSGKLSISPGGALCDVAPTVLKLMGLEQPREMTGDALI